MRSVRMWDDDRPAQGDQAAWFLNPTPGLPEQAV